MPPVKMCLPSGRRPFPRRDSGGLESFTGSPCEDRNPDGYWPLGNPAFGWHLDEGHTRLKAAHGWMLGKMLT